MTTLKRIIILYFSIIIAFVIISKLFGGHIFLMLKSVGLWVLPFFIIPVGQVIGFVIAFVLERPQIKQKVFNISYLIVFIGFATTAFYLKYSFRLHEKNYGYMEDNQKHFERYLGTNKMQEKIAFDSLSKILVDPNSFLLTGGSMHKIDTVINGINDTLYITAFRYKKRDQETILKAKFEILMNTARLIYYDIPLDTEDEHRIGSLGQVVNKNFNDAMKVVSDSLKKEIKRDFGDIMSK